MSPSPAGKQEAEVAILVEAEIEDAVGPVEEAVGLFEEAVGPFKEAVGPFEEAVVGPFEEAAPIEGAVGHVPPFEGAVDQLLTKNDLIGTGSEVDPRQ